MGDKAVATILANTKSVLATAERGLEHLSSADPTQRIPGLHNVVVFGRAVTNALQHLRGPLGAEFDDWYAPKQEEMRKDKLLRRFYEMRSEVLKEGATRTSTSAYIEHLDTSELQPLMSNPPPGAKGFFMGDQLGGSGWEVEMPDGRTQKYYVTLPEHLRVEINLNLDKPVRRHMGKRPEDQTAAGLSRLYIDYLRTLVAEAEQRFRNS